MQDPDFCCFLSSKETQDIPKLRKTQVRISVATLNFLSDGVRLCQGRILQLFEVKGVPCLFELPSFAETFEKVCGMTRYRTADHSSLQVDSIPGVQSRSTEVSSRLSYDAKAKGWETHCA